jgi:hypothetical protein
VSLLLAAGADVEARDSLGRSPLLQAAAQRNVRAARLLVVAGASAAGVEPRFLERVARSAAREMRAAEARLVALSLQQPGTLARAAAAAEAAARRSAQLAAWEARLEACEQQLAARQAAVLGRTA